MSISCTRAGAAGSSERMSKLGVLISRWIIGGFKPACENEIQRGVQFIQHSFRHTVHVGYGLRDVLHGQQQIAEIDGLRIVVQMVEQVAVFVIVHHDGPRTTANTHNLDVRMDKQIQSHSYLANIRMIHLRLDKNLSLSLENCRLNLPAQRSALDFQHLDSVFCIRISRAHYRSFVHFRVRAFANFALEVRKGNDPGTMDTPMRIWLIVNTFPV